MPRRKPTPSASSNLRRSIAGAAARSMGASEGEALPSNEEVETELRTWQSLFQEDEQRERLHDLRITALEVMQLLEEFHPYLIGGALDGTAGRYSAVEIELFADSSKDVEIALLSNGISYDIMATRRIDVDAQLSLEWNDLPVLISIYPFLAERKQASGLPKGKARQRGRVDLVSELLQTLPK